MIAVLRLACKTCIQNYLEKIPSSSLSPPLSCFPTHPVSVKQDFGKYFGCAYRLFLAPNFSVIQRIKVFTASTHAPTIPYMKSKATHDTDTYLCLFRHRGHMKPFPTLCSGQRWRTSPVNMLPGGEEETPGILQGKNCICSGSRRGHFGARFLILWGRLALCLITFNHSQEKIKTRFSWDGQHLHLSLGMRIYNVKAKFISSFNWVQLSYTLLSKMTAE